MQGRLPAVRRDVLLRRLFFSLLALGVTFFAALPDAGATAVGRGRNFGIGAAFGSPTSLVAKYFVGGGNAFDFGLGFWSYGRCRGPRNDDRFCNYDNSFDRITFNLDYLWQDNLIAGTGARLDWHIGGGGRVWAGDGNFAAAARMPVGVDLMFRKPDFLEVFLELAPALYLVPGVGLDIEAFLGVRFYF
jgi:hypothetical protein